MAFQLLINGGSKDLKIRTLFNGIRQWQLFTSMSYFPPSAASTAVNTPAAVPRLVRRTRHEHYVDSANNGLPNVDPQRIRALTVQERSCGFEG